MNVRSFVVGTLWIERTKPGAYTVMRPKRKGAKTYVIAGYITRIGRAWQVHGGDVPIARYPYATINAAIFYFTISQ